MEGQANVTKKYVYKPKILQCNVQDFKGCTWPSVKKGERSKVRHKRIHDLIGLSGAIPEKDTLLVEHQLKEML